MRWHIKAVATVDDVVKFLEALSVVQSKCAKVVYGRYHIFIYYSGKKVS